MLDEMKLESMLPQNLSTSERCKQYFFIQIHKDVP